MSGNVPRQAALLVTFTYWEAELRTKCILIQHKVAYRGTRSVSHTKRVAVGILLGHTKILKRYLPNFLTTKLPNPVLMRNKWIRLLHIGVQEFLPRAVW